MTKRLCSVLTFFSLVLLFLSAPAFAQTDENIERLKNIFESLIEKHQSHSKASGGSIVSDGHVHVEPADTYYAITLPSIKIINANGDYTEIGIVSINASAGKKEGEWKIALAIPSPIVSYDLAGQPVMNMSIGKQQTLGVWQEASQSFSKLDSSLENIAIERPKSKLKAQIPQVQIRYDFSQDDAGLWSGPAMLILKGVNIDIPEETAHLDIGELKAIFKFDRYSELFSRTFLQKPLEPHKKFDLFDVMLDHFASAGDSFNAQYSISGVRYSRKDQATPNTETVVSFENAFIAGGVEGFLSNTGKSQTQIRLSKLQVSPVPLEYENLTPTDFNIGVTIHNIPFIDIAALAQSMIKNREQPPEMAKIAQMSAIFSLPTLLTQAGTYAEFKDNVIKGKIYELALNGNVIANITAAHGVTAKLTSSFKGLDKVLAQTQALAANPQAKHELQIRSLNAALEKFKAFATVKTADDKSFIHVIDFVLTETGQLLLNGKDHLTGQDAPPADENKEPLG